MRCASRRASFKHGGRDQIVEQDDVGRLQGANRLHGQQFGVARPAADKHHLPLGLYAPLLRRSGQQAVQIAGIGFAAGAGQRQGRKAPKNRAFAENPPPVARIAAASLSPPAPRTQSLPGSTPRCARAGPARTPRRDVRRNPDDQRRAVDDGSERKSRRIRTVDHIDRRPGPRAARANASASAALAASPTAKAASTKSSATQARKKIAICG